MFDPKTIQYTFDQPVAYKELLFYPVKLREYYIFSATLTALMLEKTSDPDPIKTIPMTYLEYLFYKNDGENNLIYLLDGLLRLTLGKLDDENFKIKYGVGSDKRPQIEISEKKYDSHDFDNIRKIIANQNSISLPNEKIQKTVRDSLERARRYRQKLMGTKIADLEDQIVALSIYTGWSMDEIYDLTIRKFKKSIERADHIIHQQIYLQAEMGGMVKFKDKGVITGWLSNIEKEDEYSDVSLDLESLQSKVDFSDAKKE